MTLHPFSRPTSPCCDDSGRDDSGVTTAEYAVGTVGASAMAAVLVRLAGDGTLLELVRPWLELGLRDLPWADGWPFLRPFRGILR
ncbi:DUF4244 domain-containing protein [Aeromicrobium sp. Sec7.5]|uniref:DUF4244 domain-containing protein n=1 Tax=Aeromicrobium sp. Sec7.5 TaxID=3121276 RepID=UPI002FE4D402